MDPPIAIQIAWVVWMDTLLAQQVANIAEIYLKTEVKSVMDLLIATEIVKAV